MNQGRKYSRKCTRKGTWFHAERRELLGSRNALNITMWKWAALVVRSQYSCSCSPISQSPRTHTQNFRSPPQHLHYLHTLFSILNEVLALSMFSLYKYYKKWAKAILNRKTNNVWNIMYEHAFVYWLNFSQHFISTLSLQNQISTSTTTSLQRLKSLLLPEIIIFCYFI